MPLSESVLIIMALLATGIVASGLFRKLPIPYTVVLVLIGMLLSSLSSHWHTLAPLQELHLTPDLVLFIFLPALIFESGLNLNSRQLIKDIAPVLMLAVPALLFSTAAVGLGIWLLLPVDLIVALLFGALISATDPVAVISLFKELGTPERLTVLVEGESLLNDATAIVIVVILLGLTTVTGTAMEVLGDAVWQFMVVFFGGSLVGAIFGLFISWLMGKFTNETSAVLILSLVLAYLSFVIAEHALHVSGVMAVVACAVVLGVFGIPRLSSETVEVMHETWEFLAHICNTLLFLFVGLLVNLESLIGDIGIILFAVLLVQTARASMVYSLVPLAEKLFHLPHVTLGERHIMFWGGLKGGLAIAIVLSLPIDLPGREQLINLTLGVVLFTLLVNAPTIRPLIRKLGLDALSDDERAEVKRGLVGARHGIDAILEQFASAGLLSAGNKQDINEKTFDQISQWMPDVVESDDFRFQRLNALRVELNELDSLYRAGVIRQYGWLDLRGELQRKHDHIVAQTRYGDADIDSPPQREEHNLFLRFENMLIARLREKDWAAGFMTRYQNRRLAGHLMRDIARILMSEAALACIRSEKEMSSGHRQQLEALYVSQLEYLRSNVARVAESFPELIQRFETRVGSRVALIAALREIEEASHSGLITSKSYLYLESRLHHAIQSVPQLTDDIGSDATIELIAHISLFEGIEQDALSKIASKANTVNFLEGDTVIATGEHGDALYVVIRGELSVFAGSGEDKRQIATLGANDFFGEMALLGDHVRKADVVARTSCTLLRIKCKDVLDIARQHTAITERLNQVKAERSA